MSMIETAAPSLSRDAPLAKLSLAAVPARLLGLARGRMLTLVGIDASDVRALVRAEAPVPRQMLELDLPRTADVPATIDRVLDDLADLALALWPAWYGGADGGARPFHPWRRAAHRLAGAGVRPRFRRLPREIELPELLMACDPAGIVLMAALDGLHAGRAAATIAALDWCRAHGAAVTILCPTRPPETAPYDRILYGALEVAREAVPAIDRLIPPPAPSTKGSEIERRVREALARDAELGALFEHEVVVKTHALGPTPRVDLLWREGRVVVELDGPEHFLDPKYGEDRHRDYELLVAGYLVLRITNAQVATDLQRALEKIRRVVRFRRSEGRHS